MDNYHSPSEPALFVPVAQRGLHDIRNEITFPSKPGFVFHDSEGFESGSSSETGDTVSAFIKDRSRAVRPDLQLHAIWCVRAMIHGTLNSQ